MIRDEGAELSQAKNSLGTMVLGRVRFSGVDFEGTTYVDDPGNDRDSIGFVFSFQVPIIHRYVHTYIGT